MKNVIVLAVMIIIQSPAAKAQGVTQVEDRNKRLQIERMVFERWNKFRPVWYFWLFHNKYKKEDRRNIFQLAPTLLATEFNNQQTAIEKEKVDTIAHFHLMKEANILAEKHYHLHYKKIFDRLNQSINELLIKCHATNVSNADISVFRDEQELLHEYLLSVRIGHTDPGESQEAMAEIQREMETLRNNMIKTINLYRLRSRIKNIQYQP